MGKSVRHFVDLTAEEIALAIQVSKDRNQVHVDVGRKSVGFMPEEIAHANGCFGELAISKFFGLPWDGKFFENEQWKKWRVNGHDVSGLEVRASPQPTYTLRCEEDDRDGAKFILVRLHELPRCWIIGWAFGFEVKLPEYKKIFKDGRHVYLIPRRNLRPIESLLPEIVKNGRVAMADQGLKRPCRECGRMLWIVEGPNGKKIPLDLESQCYFVTHDTEDGKVTASKSAALVTHFQTCTKPGKFSKKEGLKQEELPLGDR